MRRDPGWLRGIQGWVRPAFARQIQADHRHHYWTVSRPIALTAEIVRLRQHEGRPQPRIRRGRPFALGSRWMFGFWKGSIDQLLEHASEPGYSAPSNFLIARPNLQDNVP